MTKSNKNCVLTINGGSSSIKFSLYKIEEPLYRLWYGEIESIGTSATKLSFTSTTSHQKNRIEIRPPESADAAGFLIDWLEKQEGFDSIAAIGHRIVHGMQHTEPEQITPALVDELKKISSYDPEHLPQEIKLIEVFTTTISGFAAGSLFRYFVPYFHATCCKIIAHSTPLSRNGDPAIRFPRTFLFFSSRRASSYCRS